MFTDVKCCYLAITEEVYRKLVPTMPLATWRATDSRSWGENRSSCWFTYPSDISSRWKQATGVVVTFV